jgi:hypothetical protein
VPDFLDMSRIRNTAGTGRTARRAAGAALALLGWFCAAGVAHADVALYQAAVPLKGLGEAERAAGFGEALKVAAVRASGRREAGSAPVVAAAAADPTSYVQQYSTTADRMLKVGFDAAAIERLLQQAGLPLWPAERPVTRVLLFVPTVAGGARAVLAAERPAERIEIERAAQLRGVPLEWPRETVDPASARAQVAAAGAGFAVLAGSAQAGWTFGHAGQVGSTQGSPTAGLHLAADSLAARYAPASTRGRNVVEVRIGGLQGVGDYAALTRYLDGLSLVRSVEVAGLSGDSARLALAVRGDLELLRRIFALDGRLVPAAQDDPTGAATADFTWQPR